MTSKFPYEVFENFIVRTPLLPINFFLKLTSKLKLDENELKDVFIKNQIIKEFIFLSSPSLYNELIKWESNNYKASQDLKISFLKYLSRASSRPTPFGLAAGLTTGIVSGKTDIVLNTKKSTRNTTLDIRIINRIKEKLLKEPVVRGISKFYPNSSSYIIGDEIRYVKSITINNEKSFVLNKTSRNEYLDKIYIISKNGITIDKIFEILKADGFDKDEINLFVEELLQNEILINEMDISIASNNEWLSHIINYHKGNTAFENLVFPLKCVQNILNKIDRTIGNEIKNYLDIKRMLEEYLGYEIDLKNIFHVDMFLCATSSYLDKNVSVKVLKGLNLLNKLSPKKTTTYFEDFKNSFKQRYGDKIIPLVEALDTDMGIGYRQDISKGEFNSLIDDINFINETDEEVSTFEITLNKFQQLLASKICDCYKKKQHIIKLKSQDFESFNVNWTEVPDTFYSTFSLIHIDNVEKVILNGGGGTSASNLITRFAHGDKKIANCVHEISEFEETLVPEDCLLAEIEHFPATEFMGNILKRQKMRNYSIPYLSRSEIKKEFQIPISEIDLRLNSKNDLVLTWSKDERIILTKLSSAHNFWSTKSLPIYHFLCDYQSQNQKAGMFLPIGNLQEIFDFIPRLEFEDLILKEATWKIEKSELNNLFNNLSSPNNLLKLVHEYIAERDIPKLVSLVDGDKGFLVNFDNVESIHMFLDSFKKKEIIFLKEFLGAEAKFPISSENELFANEIISLFKKVTH